MSEEQKSDKKRPGSPRPSAEQSDSLNIVPSIQIHSLQAKLSQTSSKSRSDRVRRFLESLEAFDSLYICPMKKPLPDQISARVYRRIVQKYEVVDYYGEVQYYAVETSSRLNYICCSNSRGFEIYMFDTTGDLIFESVRDCSSSLWLCGVDSCCVGGIETVANFRNGENFIGSVISQCNCFTPTYIIQNEFCDDKFFICGPQGGLKFPCKLCRVKSFPICLPKTEVSVGKIMYGYDGLDESLVPNPKTVGVIFPPRCSAEMKACLVTAGFMLDITYFNQRGFTFHRILRYCLELVLIAAFIFLMCICLDSEIVQK